MPPNGRTSSLVTFFFFSHLSLAELKIQCIQYQMLPLSPTSMPPAQTPCYLLISFRCHLILWKPASLGGISFSRTALPGGAFRARELAKVARPLTCTHFNPCQSPQFPSIWGCPAIGTVSATSSQTGRKGYQAACLSTLSKQKYKSSHRRIAPLNYFSNVLQVTVSEF